MDRQVRREREPDENEPLVAAVTRVVRSPKTVSLAGLWLFCLYCCLWAAAPVAVTPAMQQLYDAKHHEVRP